MEGLGIVANVIAVVDLSLKVISWCSRYAQDVKSSNDSRARLLQAIITLHYESGKIHNLLTGKNGSRLEASQKLAQAMGSSKLKLSELESLLSDNARSNLTWPLRKEKAEAAIRNIENTTKTLLEVLQIDTTGVILDIDDRTEAGQRRAEIDRLPYVSDAVWDSHAEEHNTTCLENTREDILRTINDWAEDTTDQSKTVFWLKGMAGTGKSTISRTIACSLSKAGRLGASFFFKRGGLKEDKISKFVPTIARQLAANQPALESYIYKAVLHDPTIASKGVRAQFERLILEPLSQSSIETQHKKPITIVVDALDECESDADIHLIINLLSRTGEIKQPRSRIFVTSRPDLAVRLGFSDVQGTYQDLALHEIPAQAIEHDISTFLKHEADLIKRRWDSSTAEGRKLPVDWPGDACIQLLTERAAPLFIFAATVCRFIADRRHGSPDEQLQRFLESSAEDTSSRMELTYGPVFGQLLDSHCSKRKKETIIHEVKRIVGTIINLAVPLSSSALSRLIRMGQKTIDARLDFLHSVLSIPSSSSEPIRMLHSSFRDYLMDPDIEGNPFQIDEKESSRDLVGDCFQAMANLKTDVCHLGIPSQLRSTLGPEIIDECLPPEVQYACIYWIIHQIVAGIGPGDAAAILNFLEKHLLHWFEAMILLGGSAVDAKLIDFLDDAIRFVDTDTEVINQAPLQIYHSVLVFAPTNSIVRKTFVAEIPAYLRRVTGRRTDWDPCLRSFENSAPTLWHPGDRRSTVFSPDSETLFSVSDREYVRAWRCDTGECIEELETDQDCLMALSPNGKYLALTTAEHKISLFSDTIAHVLEPAKDIDFGDLAFSRDSELLWVCSVKGQVKAWNVATGDCVRDFKCPWGMEVDTDSPQTYKCQLEFALYQSTALLISDYATAHVWFPERGEEEKSFDIALSNDAIDSPSGFSPDGKVLATPSAQNSVIKIWDLQGGQCVWELKEEDGSSLMDFVFSPDSSLMATVYTNKTIWVWDIRSGKCSAKLKIGRRLSFPGISFSPDMDFLLFTSEREDGPHSNIEVWNLNAETCVTMMRCHEGDIYHLLFSPDGQTFASVRRGGGKIQLWDWPGLLKEPLEDSRETTSLVLSHDVSTIVASYGTHELRAWNSETGKMLHEMRTKDHISCIRSYEFSPDSAFIATDGWDEAAVWGARDGTCVWQLSQRDERTRVHFSPDSQRIVVGIQNYSDRGGPCIQVWKRTNGTFDLEHTWREIWAHDFSFSPSGCLLFVNHGKGIGGFNCDTGEVFQEITFDGREITVAMAIAEDSSTLALGLPSEVQIWDLESMMCSKQWRTNSCSNLILSSAGTLLAGQINNDVQIWNWTTGETLAGIKLSENDWRIDAFLPDNSGIHTNYGVIPMNLGTVSSQYLTPTFRLRKDRIQWKEKDLIELPRDFRGVRTAISATNSELIVAFGCSSQRVTILQISEDEGLRRLLPLIEGT
ncbi:heterokaryon incompatibility protein het-E-1 [Fusarium denticulatum]|uniref:Heterokaryon incompatibility protein het-E-1 n=1 Tax=Fusarium denticulatum TaxID=48507 RepID=A0A8H5X4K7_9HYPO|nr:heterokaryon incompatibility protein het-E-1 [Fusarium denticulatum]